MKEFLSVCPYDCPDACGLILQVENDQVIGVKGNPEHPFTRGTLCPKMVHYEETIHNSARLTTPLKRIGKKGEGKFTPISWEDAIKEVAEHFKDSIKTYGGESILSYSYAGTMGVVQGHVGDALFKLLGATRQDSGICCPAKNYGWESIMGNSYSTRSQEMQYSDLVVLWSVNALATNIHLMHDVKAAQRNGAKLWAIDTHISSTLKQADDYIVIRPGSDGALALGIIYILERDHLVNEKFLAQYVQGFEELKKDILPTYTPAYVSDLTGVPEKKIEAFAHDYGMAVAPFIRLGSGLARYANGAMTVRTISCLPAVVGAYEKLGGGMLCSTGGTKAINNKSITHDDWLKTSPHTPRIMPMILLGEALTNWQDPPIKCLYVHSSNPAITAPNQNLVRQGLAREDLFLVVHERFLTDTANYADIVLPATSSVEHDDIYYSYGHYVLGTGYQAIPPIGESKSNWEVYRLLAKELGFDDDFFRLSARDLIKIVVDHADKLTAEQKQKLLLGVPVEQTVPENYKLTYATPSGKIEIKNSLEDYPLPCYVPTNGETDKEEFWLLNPPDPRILDSSFNERPFPENQEKMVAFMHPADAEQKHISPDSNVVLSNQWGELKILVHYDDSLNRGTIKTAGVWWQKYSSDEKVGLNVLMPPRFTDKAQGSTFYDVKVNIRPL